MPPASQLIFPTSGRASILGHPAGDLAVRRRMGSFPEQPYFYNYLTAEELLEHFGSLFGYSWGERRARGARVLDEVGVGMERRLAEHRPVQVRVLDEVDFLNARHARYRAKTGRPAASWTPVAELGWVPRNPPVDPAGAPYVLDPVTGLATVSTGAPYHPPPVVAGAPASARAAS